MKTNIIDLLAEKQKRVGHILTKAEIVTETKLTKPTVERWLNGDVTRFDEATIIAFCRYLDCEIGHLLYIDWATVNGNNDTLQLDDKEA